VHGARFGLDQFNGFFDPIRQDNTPSPRTLASTSTTACRHRPEANSRDFRLRLVLHQPHPVAGFSDYNFYHSAWDPRTNRQGRDYGGWKNDAGRLLDQIIREPDLGQRTSLGIHHGQWSA
jgi:hypothetical protein